MAANLLQIFWIVPFTYTAKPCHFTAQIGTFGSRSSIRGLSMAGGPPACHTEVMSKARRAGKLGALLIGMLAFAGAVARAAEIYAPQTLDRYFRLEWSKAGPNVNGYVYNSANRHAAHMQLVVEGLDNSGKVVAKTLTWIRDVPPNNRGYFETAVPGAASYRVRILSFDWVEDRLDRRKAW